MISSSVMSSPKSPADGSSGTLIRYDDPLDTERGPDEALREFWLPARRHEEGSEMISGSDGAAAGTVGRRAIRVIAVRGFASCGTATDL